MDYVLQTREKVWLKVNEGLGELYRAMQHKNGGTYVYKTYIWNCLKNFLNVFTSYSVLQSFFKIRIIML